MEGGTGGWPFVGASHPIVAHGGHEVVVSDDQDGQRFFETTMPQVPPDLIRRTLDS
jgi:hypothetical protein